MELEIRDGRKRALAAGGDNIGEIVVRGVNVMRGYHGNPAATHVHVAAARQIA